MGTSPKQAAAAAIHDKAWKLMSRREKTVFSLKLGLMLASFGWIFGNTLTPNPVEVPK